MSQLAAQAVIVGPYTADANTLHLWHMDAVNVPITDAVATGGINLGTLSGTTAAAALGAAVAPGYSGFGTSLNTVDGGQNGTAATAKDAFLTSGSVVVTLADPTTGAFTMEALVLIAFDPAKDFNTTANGGNGRGSPCIFLSGDGAADGNRVFQFRINPIGGNGVGNTSVALEFNNIHLNSNLQLMSFPVPTTGPDAIAFFGWYHVAVVYNGAANTADNLKFYWTKMDPSRTIANLLGSAQMTYDLPAGAATTFGAGNNGRAPQTANFLGIIDEVRISKIARAADAMMFAPAQPFTQPSIVSQPTGQTVDAGQGAALSVTADGLPVVYQWRHYGTNLPGATQSGYAIAAAQLTDDGPYDVVITNNYGGVTSDVATLTVRTPSGQTLAPGVTLVPVARGYASAAINATSFTRHNLVSLGNTQYIAYYGLTTNVTVGRRTLGTTSWTLHTTTLKPSNPGDLHDVVSIGIGSDGFLHCSWGMHAETLRYARSSAAWSLNLVQSTMTGAEDTVSYPQFFQCPNGDVMFHFREGASGAGDTYLNRWSSATHSWANVNYQAGQQPYIKGTTGNGATDCNAYPNFECFDSHANLVVTWVWRDSASTIESNHGTLYARSPDYGVTWLKYNGTPYTLPITPATADNIWPIATGHTLMNQNGQCMDTNGRPVIVQWWAPQGTGTPIQYHVIWNDGAQWRTNQVGERVGTSADAWPKRAIVVCDKANRLFMVFTDPERGYVPMLAWTSDPNRAAWNFANLTPDYMGTGWEPAYDPLVWERDGKLHIFYQCITGVTGGTPISVLEFDPAVYLASQVVTTPLNLAWNGAGPDWNTANSNWLNTDTSVATAFKTGDNVTFDSRGSARPSVNLTGPLSPSAVAVNAASDYTLTTSVGGGIVGSSRLTKSGAGKLVLDTDNGYNGSTLIQGGILQLGAGGSRGSLTGPITNNTAIVVNRTGTVSFNNTLAGTGSLTNLLSSTISIAGTNTLSGRIVINAGGALNLAGPQAGGSSTSYIVNAPSSVTLSGGVTLGSGGTLSLLGTTASPDARCTVKVGDNGSVNSLNGPLVLGGSGIVQIYTGDNGASTGGELDINDSVSGPAFTGSMLLRATLGVGHVYGTINLPSGAVNKADGGLWILHSTGNSWASSSLAGGTLRLAANNALPTGVTLAVTGKLDLGGFNQQVASLGTTGADTGIITNSSTTSASTLTVHAVSSGAFPGAINDSGGVGKVGLTLSGGGTLTLSGVSTYTGDTTISAGTLALSGAGALNSAAGVILLAAGATFDVSGVTAPPYPVHSGQTLSGGGITGGATIKGALSVDPGSFLALTYVSGTPALNVTGGALTLNGNSVTVAVSGAALGVGSYKLIAAGAGGSVAGTLQDSVTVGGSGLAANTTASLSLTSGELWLDVASTEVPQRPVITGFSYDGANLILSGTNGIAGNTYYVLASTNLSDWDPVFTNVFEVNGVFSVTNAVTLDTPARFFRLQLP